MSRPLPAFAMVEPVRLQPADLDAFLRHGWYRMHERLFTTRYLLRGGDVWAVAWSRLDLHRYEPTPSLRRVLTRVARRFEVDVAPLALDEEKEEVYARYVKHVGGERAPTLEKVLFGEERRGLFDTWEISLREQGRLVACSVFDLGAEAAQSVAGIYDPSMSRFSLGLATMLIEIEYARDLGLRWHYAGYLVPGDPKFEYKARVSPLEWLDERTGAWRPLRDLDPEQLAGRRVPRELGRAQAALDAAGIPSKLRVYPPFAPISAGGEGARSLVAPLFLELEPGKNVGFRRLVTVPPDGRGWEVGLYREARDLKEHYGATEIAEYGESAEFALLVKFGPPTPVFNLDDLVRVARS